MRFAYGRVPEEGVPDMGLSPAVIRVPVSLRRLFPRASFVGCADVRVTDATERSDLCRPRMLFAAIPGTRVDGASFADDAVRRGASSLLADRPIAGVSVPQCIVPDVRQAYAELCAALSGSPSRRMKLAGVTGTNGKTTVTWLVRSMLESCGRRTGLLGTIEYSDGRRRERSPLTTPDSRTLSNWLASMLEAGATHAAMEVSSHALDQRRIAGTRLDVAVITNVTQDHFDYHRNYQNYLATKARIVELVKPDGLLVASADDAGAAAIAENARGRLDVVTFGLRNPADVTAASFKESLAGTRFFIETSGTRLHVATPLIGRHNVLNCLAAAAVARRLEVPDEAIAEGIGRLAVVPGRMERIAGNQPFAVFVDYAHTGDALAHAVATLKALTPGRVLCVFGAGGDRDRSKRPLLGRAAAAADLPIVTSDNPRSENPQQIIRDILPGLHATGREPYIEPDRAEAIRWAIRHAAPGDAVLIAGKGHETEQIIGSERLPFDDRQTALEALPPVPHFLKRERAMVPV
ncbi:MAG: UDP-N-acetylmuramoyl-L-alanyl-D-glutamate--2,6-diaminopimelate ligase [Planctomycetes bacterium]|nr:UDP-N-acetylmuramoyl-L-alanyl-D-glutamate--2,6-diaminopimelate ligase [Planctomycetota bacterium]